MQKPNITQAQIVAFVAALLAVLVKVFGLTLDKEQQDAILDLVQVLAPVLMASDALIRFGRSRPAPAASVTVSSTTAG